MNEITFTTTLFSILIYGLLIHHSYAFPARVFISMKKQLLQSLDNKKPGEWRRSNSNNDTENAIWLWNKFQDRSLKILSNKKWELFKIIFIQGGIVFLCWSICSFPLFFPNEYGVVNFLPSKMFEYLLLIQITFFLFFYFYHLRRFKEYIFKGEQEKFLEEVKDHLAKLQNDAENKFFYKNL